MQYTKVYKSVFLIVFAALGGHSMAAQTCEGGELYGWATQNGGTTGGNGGSVVEVNTMADLKTQLSKSGKLIIYVKGKLSGSFSASSNKTIIGYPGAQVGGISLSGVSNVIIRNIIVRGAKCATYDECKAGTDAVSLNNSHNVWLDHLDVADGQDGNMDITSGSDFVTVSYCKFSYTYDKQHAFSNLNGSADDATGDRGKLNVTFHHNWWADGIMERQPRMRFGKFHVANNLYTSQKANYVAGVGIEAKLLFEGNVSKATGAVVQYFPGGVVSNVLLRNNSLILDTITTNGAGFVPTYKMPIDNPDALLESKLRSCAGATLGDPKLVLTSVAEQALLNETLVYPNPFQKYLHIQVEEGTAYELLNAQGQTVLQGYKVNGETLMPEMPAGMYLLKLKQGEQLSLIRLEKRD